LLSSTLYQRRLFPYYSFTLLGGIDAKGDSFLYKYDAVGSFERVHAVCSGRLVLIY
jgi:20S proteasome subunit beta 6